MIHIQKGTPLKEFTDFIQTRKPTNWEDIHQREHEKVFRLTRESILESEQKGLGGYTERPLSTSTREKISEENRVHIDHYKKRVMFPRLTFDWNNLVVEDRNPNYGACYKDRVLNNADDYKRLLNPVVDYPESMLTYRPDGQMRVKEKLPLADSDRAQFTIDTFNLNHVALRKKRENVIRDILNCSGLTDDEIRQAMTGKGFPTVVEWALKLRNALNPGEHM
jgi:uncharacterized protein (TIGR02646 family)